MGSSFVKKNLHGFARVYNFIISKWCSNDICVYILYVKKPSPLVSHLHMLSTIVKPAALSPWAWLWDSCIVVTCSLITGG